ncbi:MAG: T9SS type A sorting domain-containing protein [Phaeodactylibacter sp.]|nr:T9SS type A sorting domain-containing protein [Phaeodactylibacter sp.]MCB9298114.1 T9SS type A sorting domain-containing protein [Lewinellaceae bacterium]
MRRMYFLLSCLCLLFAQVQAQLQLTPTVLASAGGSAESGSLKLDWTAGETRTDAYASSSLQLGEGFHQGYLAVFVSVYEAPELDFDIQAFPNPAGQRLFLGTDSPEPLTFELISLDGKTVRSQPMSGYGAQMDISALPDALYLLRAVNRDGLLLKTFKILKSNF